LRHNEAVRAQVIVLAGPSGAGKSRLAERLGLPVLRLDDFYKSGGDPTLPVIQSGANTGLTDWDHPDSWLRAEAVATLERLCRDGHAEVPVYDLARDGRCGTQVLDLGEHRYFVAEGIFAQEVVPASALTGGLAEAYCVRQHAGVTFWRRLTRDLRERRKPPLVLVRRGWALLRDQQRVVSHAVDLGCRPVTPDQAYAEISRLLERQPAGG
jgi:uridine kinase